MSNPLIAYSDDRNIVSLYNGAIVLSRVPSQGRHIYAGTASLTPELAKELLANQKNNRKVNSSRVDIYAQDMQSAKWKLTLQGIQLDDLARMNDGQHRCLAVVASSELMGERFEAPEIYFSMGFSQESMLVVDTGLQRRATHSATIAGENFRPGTDIIIRPTHEAVMCAMVTDWDKRGKVPPMSPIVKTETIQKFADPIEWVLTTPFNRYFNNTAVRGLLAAAFYRYRTDSTTLRRIDEFKNLFDGPYNPDDWKNPGSSRSTVNLNHPDTNPLLLRHIMEEKKKTRAAGAGFRLDAARMAGQALTQYLQDNAPGVPYLTAGTMAQTYFVPLAEALPWNDNSWVRRLNYQAA